MKVRVGLCAVFLVGCATTVELPKSSEEAANVYVSAYPAVPWTDIREKLIPKNNLTIEQARTLSASVTQIQTEQVLSVISAGLRIGLPGRTDTRTQATDAAGKTTSTRSSSQSIGTVPDSTGVTAPTISGTDLAPDLSKGPLATSVDGMTTLMGGTALYQQAQILDNQIANGVEPLGYQAHLITFQVNLQPSRRNLPYDAYVNISLLPGDWQQALDLSKPLSTEADALPPIIVYPLIVSDAFEFTSAGRSAEAIRQVGLQLAGTISQIGANAGFNSTKDEVKSVIGLDENSLVTLGRVSESTLRIRLGATSATKGEWAMVPRTYNVSVVVFTRFAPGDVNSTVKSVSVVTETEFKSAIDGAKLPSSRLDDRSTVTNPTKRLFDQVFTEYSPDEEIDGACSVGAIPADKEKNPNNPNDHRPSSNDLLYLNLLRAVDRGDYNFVKNCLKLAGTTDKVGAFDARKQVGLRRLLAELINMQTPSRYSKFLVPLRSPPELILPPEEQYVVMKDDEKTSTTISLRGGAGLGYGRAKAVLELGDKDCPEPGTAPIGTPATARSKVFATQISVMNDGQEVQLVFPSVASLGYTPTSAAQAAPKKGTPPATAAPSAPSPTDVRLRFYFEKAVYSTKAVNVADDAASSKAPLPSPPPTRSGLTDGWGCYVLNRSAKPEEPKPQPSNIVTATQTSIVSAHDGTGRINLQVGELDKKFVDTKITKPPYTKPLTLVVTGADVRSDGTPGVRALGPKGISIDENSVATLQFGNLTPTKVVTIATFDGSTPPKPIGTPITLTVERAAAK